MAQLLRIALCSDTVSWARAVLPLRLRRQKLGEPSKTLTEEECTEWEALTEGENCDFRIRDKLVIAGFHTFDSIPRMDESISNLRFSCPKVKGIPEKDAKLFTTWLAHLSTREKHLACLNMLKVKLSCLPSMETAVSWSKANIDKDIWQKGPKIKQIKEASREDAPLNRRIGVAVDHILAKCELLWSNWRMDVVPL